MEVFHGSIKRQTEAPRDETNFIDAIINLISSNYTVDLDRIHEGKLF